MLVQYEFWVKPGKLSLPQGQQSIFWGLATDPTSVPQLPGPLMEARVGDTLQVTLHNHLSVPVSLIFPGVNYRPEPQLDNTGKLRSLAPVANPGETVTYTLSLDRPGTFLYESGTEPDLQTQMGLFGPLIVRPQDASVYGPGTGSEYDQEALLIISELDLEARTAITTSGNYDRRNYHPHLILVNGRGFPDALAPPTADSQPLSSWIHLLSGQRLLLRVINAGFFAHTIASFDLDFKVIAENAFPLITTELDRSYHKLALTLPPGHTFDLVLEPAAGEHYLFCRDLNLDNLLLMLIDVREVFPDTPPPTPGLLTLSWSPPVVELSWQVVCTVDGYLVERKVDDGPFHRLGTLLGTVASYRDDHLAPNHVYTYRLCAFNSQGTSPYTNEVTIHLSLPAPSNLMATAISATAIKLDWQDNSDSETGFIIERRSSVQESFSEIARVPANTTTYLDSQLQTNTTYSYRVAAYNALGTSGYSNIATVTTPEVLPQAPANLVASPGQGNRILLRWVDKADNETGFIIERRTPFQTDFRERARVGANVTQFTDTGLSCGLWYYYRVRAYNSAGISPPSNTAYSFPGC